MTVPNSTILVIDDDTNITSLLARRLAQEGFDLMIANDGKSGLSLANNQFPDLILLDLLMPEMSGKEVLKELKENPTTSAIPVIIVSAVADTDDKIDGLSLGANDYIVKPFRFKEVIARINTQLRIASMQKNLEEKHNDLLEKNKVLKRLAVTDQLTGLLNKRYLMKRLRSEIFRSIRYGDPVSVIMLDIDHFKKFNDTYGHVAGDDGLRHVADIVKDVARTIDVVTRYGGEEFVIICPSTDLEGVVNLAERIRSTVEKTPCIVNDFSVAITLSIGVKCMTFDSETDSEAATSQIIESADMALYEAKKNGRNRVEIG